MPHIKDVADRFAREGNVALAPDLYHGKQTTEPDEAGIALIKEWLAAVKVPVLVVAGETRLGSNLDDAGEWRLKQSVKDLTVKRFPGTGHVIHGYRPEPFLEALEPFLRRVRAPEGATGP